MKNVLGLWEELKHFSVNKRFLAQFCDVLIFASLYQDKEEKHFCLFFVIASDAK